MILWFTLRITIEVIPKDRCEGSMAISIGHCQNFNTISAYPQIHLTGQQAAWRIRVSGETYARSCLLLRGLWKLAIMRPAKWIFMVENESRGRLCRTDNSNQGAEIHLTQLFLIPQPLSTKIQTIFSSDSNGYFWNASCSPTLHRLGMIC